MPAQHWTVSPAEAGQKLLQFLQRRLAGDTPKSVLMKWIRTGQVRVDGGRAKPFQRLDAGQTIRVPPFAEGRTVLRAEQRPDEGRHLDIVHQDEDLLVLSKPAGLPMHPGSGHTDCLTARLAAAFPNADFAPTPAHRLDKDTSGLVLVALSYHRLAALHEQLRHGDLSKRYLAWVEGDWPHEGEIMMEDTLTKTGAPGREKVTSGENGKPAAARVRPLERRGGSSGRTLLEVELLTGRTHQIRVQLSKRGHPIVGDRKYGRGSSASDAIMRLHAWRIILPEAEYRSPPPWEAPYDVDMSVKRN